MHGRSKVFTTAAACGAILALGALPAQAAPAPAPKPVTADGVTGVQVGKQVTLRFTPAAVKLSGLAKALVAVSCRRQPPPPILALADEDEPDVAYATGRIGSDGVLRVTLSVPRKETLAAYDSCDVDAIDSEPSTRIATAALTPAGAVWADETVKAKALHQLLDRAHGTTGYRPASALPGVTPLPAADATPPAGATGYWTDGGARAAVVAVSAAGRRLLIEDLGDGVLRTNVLEQSDPIGGLLEDVVDEDVSGDVALRKEDDPGRSPYRGHDVVDAGDGVRASVAGRRLSVRFGGRSAKAFRAIAGRRVVVACFDRPRASPFPSGVAALHPTVAVARVPRHGGRVTLTLPRRVGDACFMADDETMIASLLTRKAGRDWWADLDALSRLEVGHVVAPGHGAYRTTEDVVARGKGAVVAMSGPDGAAPSHGVGYWSDGARHAAEAVRSASGRRIFLADEGDGMVRTNYFGELSAIFFMGLGGGDGSGSASAASTMG